MSGPGLRYFHHEWKPFPYQKPFIKNVVSALKKVGRALLVMATGTGKTPTSAFALKDVLRGIENPKVLILAHANLLLDNAKDTFSKMGIFPPWMTYGIYNGYKKNSDTNLVFASFQTMAKNLKKFSPDEFDVVLVDESHHATAKEYNKVLRYFTPKYLLGMTATPDRETGQDIREVFGEPVVNLSLAEAIGKGYLTPVEYRIVTDNLDKQALKALVEDVVGKGKRVSLADVNRRVFIKARDAKAAELIKKEKKKAIIFCQNITHARTFAKMLPDSELCHSGNSPDHNRWVMNGFKSGAIKHILVVDMFNEGVDIPDTEMLVFMRGTESVRIYLQQLGRGLRLAPGKQSVLVLDFVANINRLMLVDSLVKGVAGFGGGGGSGGGKLVDDDKLHVSGVGFDFNFSHEVRDLVSVLNRLNVEFYSFQEFLEACKKMKFLSIKDYHTRYKQDMRLPSDPPVFYGSFWVKNGGWDSVTGKKYRVYYSFSTFVKVCHSRKFSGKDDYQKNYKTDKKLPSNPDKVYGRHWVNAGGWNCVSGRNPRRFYTFSQFLRVCKKMKFVSQSDYNTRRKLDPKIPSNPDRFYKGLLAKNGGLAFVTGREVKNFYTFQQFFRVCKKMKFRTWADYKARHKKDPRLPSNPNIKYKNELIKVGGLSCVFK